MAADKYHELFHNEMNEKEYDRVLLDFFANLLKPASLVCDAGCGPYGHVGRYLANKGLIITGADISDRCIELASRLNPDMSFAREDIVDMSFDNEYFDAIISYHSIISTPKNILHRIFLEFNRVLRSGRHLLVVVKPGTEEGFQNELVGI